MNARIEQILTSIVHEKCLYINQTKTNEEENEAWVRVAKKNKISANEVKTIFNCLVKKYHAEKAKSYSTWKLFQMMDNLHQSKDELNGNNKEDVPMEEEDDAFVELLEVHDEGDYYTEEEEDSPNKSSNSANSANNDASGNDETKAEEINSPVKQAVKILNNFPKYNAELKSQGKGNLSVVSVEPKVATPAPVSTRSRNQSQTLNFHNNPNILKTIKTTNTAPIQTLNSNESLKRKVYITSRSNNIVPAKRQKSPENNKIVQINVSNITTASPTNKQTSTVVSASCPSSTQKLKEVSQYQNSKKAITTPNNLKSEAQEVKLETNGSSNECAKLSVVTSKINGASLNSESDENTTNSDSKNLEEAVVRFGNDDNNVEKDPLAISDQLTPMLYKNLCNSKRYEAFGLYVCNIMNRLTPRTATNLEMKILQLVVDYTSKDIETTS